MTSRHYFDDEQGQTSYTAGDYLTADPNPLDSGSRYGQDIAAHHSDGRITFSAFVESLRKRLGEARGPVESAAILSLVEGLSEIEDLASKHGLNAVTHALAEIVGIERYTASAAGSIVQALSVDIGERLGEEYAFETSLGHQADYERHAQGTANDSPDGGPDGHRDPDNRAPSSKALVHENPPPDPFGGAAANDGDEFAAEWGEAIESDPLTHDQYESGPRSAYDDADGGREDHVDQHHSGSPTLQPPTHQPLAADTDDSIDLRESPTGAWTTLRNTLAAMNKTPSATQAPDVPSSARAEDSQRESGSLPEPVAAPRATDHGFLPGSNSEELQQATTAHDDDADGFADLAQDAERYQHLRTDGPELWSVDGEGAAPHNAGAEPAEQQSSEQAASSTFQWSDGSDMDLPEMQVLNTPLLDIPLAQPTPHNFRHAETEAPPAQTAPLAPPANTQTPPAHAPATENGGPADAIAKASSRGAVSNQGQHAGLGRVQSPNEPEEPSDVEKERLWLDDFLIGRSAHPRRHLPDGKVAPTSW